MINFISSELHLCDDPNGIYFKLIGASMAKLWPFFLLACKEMVTRMKEQLALMLLQFYVG